VWDTVNWRLVFANYVDYTFTMSRPPKNPSLRMDTDLRVPMTTAQKQLLDAATADEPSGKAAWARDVLLEAARKKLAKGKGTTSAPK
jgi:hypothetical protein